ncbi:MAG: VOC family protein [Xanthobacteraceae bacterium]
MIEPRSVVHFSIAVSDLDASQKFYTEILGLTLVQAAPANGMVFLRAGNDHRHSRQERCAASSRCCVVFLASKGVEVFEEEDRKKGVFVGSTSAIPTALLWIRGMGRNEPSRLT